MPRAIPNFVVIGAAKAGTTSLHGWLAQHPQIFVPRQKELHYFAGAWLRENSAGPGDARALQDLAGSWDDYLAHYREADGERAIGDVSPSYFYWWPSRREMQLRLGDPKIILLLRDPVHKALSQYAHLLRDGRETVPFREALALEPERAARGFGALWRYVGAALYAEPTARFLETFGPDRLTVLLFEDMVRAPADSLRQLFTFLGVDPDVEIDTNEVRNRSGAPRSRVVAGMLNSQSAREFARSVLPAPLVTAVGRRLTHMNTGAKPVLDDASRVFITERVSPDVARLEQILGRRTGWLS